MFTSAAECLTFVKLFSDAKWSYVLRSNREVTATGSDRKASEYTAHHSLLHMVLHSLQCCTEELFIGLVPSGGSSPDCNITHWIDDANNNTNHNNFFAITEIQRYNHSILL